MEMRKAKIARYQRSSFLIILRINEKIAKIKDNGIESPRANTNMVSLGVFFI